MPGFSSFDFSFSALIKIAIFTAVVFLASYALICALCRKNIKEEIPDKRVLEPVIAITVTGMLSVVYLIFSTIQILYLFIGRMSLPDGYTYSAYARQGFFQLLAVCILNLILVLFCLSFFKDSKVLKIILTIISGCTFIMILSSVLRMLTYIARYNLTFLRIFVLWSLAVIFLLMCGVTVTIYCRHFPLFFYSVAVTTVFYIGLSFSHPDYIVASYNLDPAHLEYLDDYDIHDSKRYLSQLSADAAPILLDESRNLYLSGNPNEQEIYDPFYRYYENIMRKADSMSLRSFNFSLYQAKKSAGL
ncbi:MAG: DUF4173 domain-containing protein [Ruminococcus sp.]|nr:DUF4173 domain-containing protein [Ruminococcus sp.]